MTVILSGFGVFLLTDLTGILKVLAVFRPISNEIG